MSNDPIKTQKEYDEVFQYVVKQTMETLKITETDAMLRVAALRESGILDSGGPNDRVSQIMIDAFMTSDQWNKPEYQEQVARLEKTKSHNQ
jgi:dihydroxyacetone kinase-like predicted kinase